MRFELTCGSALLWPLCDDPVPSEQAPMNVTTRENTKHVKTVVIRVSFFMGKVGLGEVLRLAGLGDLLIVGLSSGKLCLFRDIWVHNGISSHSHSVTQER